MLRQSDLDNDQLEAIRFLDSGEDSLLSADIGTGKTVIGLTAAKHALERKEVNRWLVLAPLLVATDTWAKEPPLWDHLRDLDVAIACGGPEQREKAVHSDAPIVVTNYENLPWLLEHFPKNRTDTLPFDGLMCDEIDKLKSVSSERFKAFRNRVNVFNKRVGMTGTLVPNDLTEMWGQVYMVDGGQSFSSTRDREGNRLGRSFYNWRKHFFFPIDYNQHNWWPFPSTEDALLDCIEDLTYRLPAKNLPPVNVLQSAELTLPGAVRANYRELEKEFLLIVEDTEGRERTVDAANTAILQSKLQQLCAGFLYVDKTSEAVWHSYAKFEWLDDLIRTKLPGEQLMIFYHFKEELAELQRRFPILSIGSGVSNGRKLRVIDQWNAGDLQLLAMHPQSAAHGLNLQKSGAHNIAFLTMPWSGGMFRQAVGRLARRGQVAERIDVHTASFIDTVDRYVFRTVMTRAEKMDRFLESLYARQYGGSRN